PAFVPCHADRFAAEFLLGNEQFRPKSLRDDDVLLRFLRRKRPLHLAERLALAAARPVIRNALADVVVLKRFHIRPLRRHLRDREWPASDRAGGRGRSRDLGRILPDRPAQTAFHEFLKAGVPPRPLVVAPGGVENAALSLRADPRPRLLRPALLAVFEDRSILLVVLGVDVGLVPAFESFKALQDRMVGGGGGFECAGPVT